MLNTLICPACGGELPEDDQVWIYQTKFYCSERCVRKQMGGRQV